MTRQSDGLHEKQALPMIVRASWNLPPHGPAGLVRAMGKVIRI